MTFYRFCVILMLVSVSNSHQTFGSVTLIGKEHIMVIAVACWAVLGLIVIADSDYNRK